MKCEDCDREAGWLVVSRGVDWISRFCRFHLRSINSTSEVYERTKHDEGTHHRQTT